MKATFAVGKLTIDWANGVRQVVTFGGLGGDACDSRAIDGGIARVLEAAAAGCPVILWDEAGERRA